MVSMDSFAMCGSTRFVRKHKMYNTKSEVPCQNLRTFVCKKCVQTENSKRLKYSLNTQMMHLINRKNEAWKIGGCYTLMLNDKITS